MTATSTAPVLGLAEAAKACGVSVSTIRRKREDLKELGATESNKGWRIPVPALIAVGLMAPTTAPVTETPLNPPVTATPDSALIAQLETLREQLAEAKLRAAVAEERAVGAQALVAAHERTIQTQAMALRMLEKGSTPSEPATPSESPAEGHTRPAETRPEPTSDTEKDGPKPVPFLRRLLSRR
jgi:hypothetical protein